jgi:hypothetical protein
LVEEVVGGWRRGGADRHRKTALGMHNHTDTHTEG